MNAAWPGGMWRGRAWVTSRDRCLWMAGTSPAKTRRRVSEVEVVIVRGRMQARPAVVEQRPETRPGFQLHVPGLHRGELPPGHVAEIVDHREMGGRGEIRQRHALAGQPFAR